LSWLLALLANVLAIDPAEADAIAARLAGQRFVIDAERRAVTIDDVAGEGPPRVGVIERAGGALWLVAADGRWKLAGPLARPRIAGPGYTVWVIGSPVADAEVPTLTLRRLGVLRRPVRKGAESGASTTPSN
jgi:hypothetical protein